MYKEYRDTTLNGAVEQMYDEMGSRHRARFSSIQVHATFFLSTTLPSRSHLLSQFAYRPNLRNCTFLLYSVPFYLLSPLLRSSNHHQCQCYFRSFSPVQIIKTAAIPAIMCKRENTKQFHNSAIKFPLPRRLIRAPNRSLKTTFKASRPNSWT
jgi:ribosomal protein L20A (L18A)